MMQLRLALVLSLVFAVACKQETAPAPTAPAKPAPAADTKPAEPAEPEWQAGTAPADTKAVKLADLVANPDGYKDQAVRVEGTVQKVCEHRGCWIEIADGESKVLVKSLDHAIAFPKNFVGKRMVVDGMLRVDGPTSCGEHEAQAEAHAGAHHEEEGHECPAPKVLVEVRRAELAQS